MNNCKLLVAILIVMLFSSCSIQRNENAQNSSPTETEKRSLPPESSAMNEATTKPTPTPDPNLVASYATTLYDKNEHRINNIKTAAEEINQVIIQSGDTFSFNEVVGKRTEGKGYEKAPILVDGEKETGTGGGICQLSTTIYNAALEADLKILERHSHSKKVPYVPEGKDAAVVYPSKDMRFKNTADFPIQIVVAVSEDEITVKFYKKGRSETKTEGG